jgi:dipeptidyl aminopeptidase/acylaminoacyl peptidase
VARRGQRRSLRQPCCCRLAVLDLNRADAPGRFLACSTVDNDPPLPAAVQRFQVPSPADGAPLDAWFLTPPGTTGAVATVLVVHGGPMAAFGECFSIDAQALCAAGFGVLYTNPHGSTGYGDAFTHAVIGDWGGAPAADVLAVIDHAVALGWVDGDRVAMTGNSYGGYLAAWLACTTDRFRAAVIENPATDLLSMYGTSDIGATFLPAQLAATPANDVEPYLRWSPILHADTCRTPILFVVGTEDRRCPPSQAFELHRALHACGTPSEVLVLPGASHEGSTYGPIPCRLAHDDALVEWMQRWLRP